MSRDVKTVKFVAKRLLDVPKADLAALFAPPLYPDRQRQLQPKFHSVSLRAVVLSYDGDLCCGEVARNVCANLFVDPDMHGGVIQNVVFAVNGEPWTFDPRAPISMALPQSGCADGVGAIGLGGASSADVDVVMEVIVLA